MKGSVAKWGNSLAIRLPRAVADDANLLEGGQVEFEVDHGRLIVTPARPSFTLEELMGAYDPEKHRHDDIDWGDPVGNEVW